MSGKYDQRNWFNSDVPNTRTREFIVGGLERWGARSLDFYVGYEFKLSEFLKDRFDGRRLGKVGDYGCSDGFCGFLVAEALDAEKLIMMDLREEPLDRVQRLIDNSNDRIQYVNVGKASTFPEGEKDFDLMMINDVLGFVGVDVVIPLLQSIKDSLTENGFGVITVTDNSSGQRDRVLQLYDKVRSECPELLQHFVFIAYDNLEQQGHPENRRYKVLTRSEPTDLGDVLQSFIKRKDDDAFVINEAT